MQNTIAMQNVSKSFGAKQALRNVTFTVEQGEIFGFLGPSGAGKTTTVKILTGQLRADGGDAGILGKNAAKLQSGDYRNLGIITDNSGIYERLSCMENLALFAKIFDVPNSRAEELLDKVGLGEEKKTITKKLSKGMKQRLLLARALLHKPALLFLDEPTSGLDPATALDIHTLLREANAEGATIFLTTHNMEEATKLCDRVALLNEGVIAEMDAPLALCRKYATNKIRIELNDGSVRELENLPENAQQIAELFAKGEVARIHSEEPNLEQVFLHVTGRDLQ